MLYIPEITGYKPFYIQSDSDLNAHDTFREWVLVAKTNPFPALPSAKEPYGVDYPDENGKDEWVTDMYYEQQTMSVSFWIKCIADSSEVATAELNRYIRSFFSYVSKGYLKVYDAYTGLGWKDVRYASYKEDSFLSRGDWARAIFSIEFTLDDPVTAMTYNNGAIKESTGLTVISLDSKAGNVEAMTDGDPIDAEIDATTGDLAFGVRTGVTEWGFDSMKGDIYMVTG